MCEVCTNTMFWQWEQFIELGKDIETSVIEDKVAAMNPNQCALLIYTVRMIFYFMGCCLSHLLDIIIRKRST